MIYWYYCENCDMKISRIITGAEDSPRCYKCGEKIVRLPPVKAPVAFYGKLDIKRIGEKQ